MRRFITAALIIAAAILLLLLSASCSDGTRSADVMVFSSFTEATKETEATSHEVTVSVDSTEIPTLESLPETPEVALSFFTNFGLISDSVQTGNLRSAPSTSGLIVGRLYTNSGLEILEERDDGWLYVSSGGIEGYVSGELVLKGEEAVRQAMAYENLWVLVTSQVVNIRVEPGKDSAILARTTEGQTFRVKERLEGWYLISHGTDEGYISSDCVRMGYTVPQAENWDQLAGLSGEARTMVEYGMKYLGLPYVYGGESMTEGCDCSYFTGMCLVQVGIHVERTSRGQAEQGTAVSSMAEAVPGDLLFYNSQGTGIDHVAIYIGDGKILHNAHSIGCVSISSYNYCGEPVAIRRYF